MEKKNKIIAVDFDGTLCENKWPEIGAANDELIEYLKKRQASGDKIILWTCRVGELLQQAVRFCYNRGLIFDAVNENLPETLEWMDGDSRKIFANEYIDDRSVPIDICREKSEMECWAEDEVAIACRREKPDRKDGEWDYGCACYESALKAFQSLCNDGHSGFSIGLTKAILNRLIDGKVLTPVEGTDDEWTKVFDRHGRKTYQSKRMSSLFKDLDKDGNVRYNDTERYCGFDIADPDTGFRMGILSRILDENFPITMPYTPNNTPYKIYTEGFLAYPAADSKPGDYDTIGVIYIITPTMEKVTINRYFKCGENDMLEEIDEAEYVKRKMKVQWADLLSSDFKRIKEAFGFELYDWQKKYLRDEPVDFPIGRGDGKSFTINLKALLGDGDTVTFDELKRRRRMGKRESIYVDDILDMDAKLRAAGFTTNVIKRR